MYFVTIALLLLILPAVSIGAEIFLHADKHAAVLSLVGKWWTFWAVGVRLFVAGLRQVLQPAFTAKEIFEIQEDGALPIVRELGFANPTFGTLGLCSLFRPEWTVPGAIVGGLYYGLAGAGHVARKSMNATEWTAMVSDFGVFIVLGVFVWRALS